jgi:hypothetical protein
MEEGEAAYEEAKRSIVATICGGLETPA